SALRSAKYRASGVSRGLPPPLSSVILGVGMISFQNPALLVPHRAVYLFIPILSNPVGFEVEINE
ncbi:MAG TPA: hypothetical protein VJ949_07125, partial [Cryomorphaceae bacterium]|nr:hypothetical protein [Cryomorphaceae bacterium]